MADTLRNKNISSIFRSLYLIFLFSHHVNRAQLYFDEFELPNGNDRWAPRKGKDKLVIVETPLGKVIGRNDNLVTAFLGIPYAEPPVGKLRFRPPQPKRKWQPKIYNATSFSPECLQSSLFASESEGRPKDEDCLYLNVWKPSAKNIAAKSREKNQRNGRSNLFPVLIWIYGGAFVHGGSSLPEYYGDKLAARGVIVVSFNYRLGALGFLVSTSDGLFGNYGLDDQKTAVQWVQDNIIYFGGDPDRVTLFGESAGAMSIGLQVLDQQLVMDKLLRSTDRETFQLRRKLFQAVILQSNPLGYKYRSIAVANFIGTAFKEQLDCEDLRCMQSESAEELMHVQDTLMAVPRSIGDFFAWGPVTTDQAYYREARLRPGSLANITVRQPIEALKEMRRMDIPVIIGTNADEGTVFVFTAFPTRMSKIIYQFLVWSFFRTSARKVLKMYSPLARRISDSHDPDYRQVLSRIIGDYLFRCPNQYFAKLLSQAGSRVFLYEFALPTRTPGFPCCDGLACHTCELPYVFNQLEVIEADYSWTLEEEENNVGNVSGNLPDIFGASPGRKNNSYMSDGQNNHNKKRVSLDVEVSRVMADFWTTFAIYSDPNGLPSLNGYVEGSGPVEAPHWPRLLGELTTPGDLIPSEDDILHGISPNNIINSHNHHYDHDNNNMDDNAEDNAEDLVVIETMRNKEEDSTLYEMISNHHNNEYDMEDTNNNNDEDVMLIRDEPDGIIIEDNRYQYSPQQQQRRRRSSTTNDDQYLYNQQMIRMKSTTTKLSNNIYNNHRNSHSNNRNNKINRLKSPDSFAAMKSMHQMIFDEDIRIDIFNNDCICNAWNRLEYVF